MMIAWVCWSEASQKEGTETKIHLQGSDRVTTLCGIFQAREWSHECHPDPQSVNCKRCLKKLGGIKAMEEA